MKECVNKLVPFVYFVTKTAACTCDIINRIEYKNLKGMVPLRGKITLARNFHVHHSNLNSITLEWYNMQELTHSKILV